MRKHPEESVAKKKISILELLNHQTETKEFQGEYPRVVAKFHRQLFFP